MIYEISEYVATILECLTILGYLIFSLGYKRCSLHSKVFKTVLFSFLIVVNALLWDNVSALFEHELWHISSYVFLFYIMSLSLLRGNWWRQLILIIIAVMSIFLINLLVTVCSEIILGDNCRQILSMRNPARIFLLFITKIGLATNLFAIGNFVRIKRYSLHFKQCIIIAVLLITSLVAGVTVEEMLLENNVSDKYATIIMICISVIVILLFYIIVQLSLKNRADILKASLQTKLHNDEIRISELVNMNLSVRMLKHDLNNHITVLKRLVNDHDFKQVKNYVEKINNSISDIPATSSTNNSALNAIIDVKRIVCRTENIDLKCYLQYNLPEFDDFSFSVVLGNLLDNAIEAEIKEKNKEIKLSVTADSNIIDILIQNRTTYNVLINGRLPDTTKTDNSNHGLGMLSIFETVERNNGLIDMYEQDGWFVVHVIMKCL